MDDTFFANPNLIAPFLNDTTIALGLAECNVSSSDNSYFDGRTHYDQVLKTTFEGTTGDIVPDLSTGTRDPRHAVYQITTTYIRQWMEVSSHSNHQNLTCSKEANGRQ
jgi:hypothetical protein